VSPPSDSGPVEPPRFSELAPPVARFGPPPELPPGVGFSACPAAEHANLLIANKTTSGIGRRMSGC
jgi:hypothetical protein